MIFGVEDDGVLGPLEGAGRLDPGKRCIELASELLELIVGLGRLGSAEDACHGTPRGLVAPGLFVGEVVVFLAGVHLSPLWPLVVAFTSDLAITTASAAATAAFFLLALLAQLLEVVVVLRRMAAPVVVDAEWVVIHLFLASLGRVLANVLGVGLSH